ncbi:alpha-glucan family phosphorylase, partial [Spirochaetota bacterium]
KLKPLIEIAYNMWWVWNIDAIELFRRLDVELWREVHDPVKFLGALSQKVLDEASESESFLAHMNHVQEELDMYMNRKSWFHENNPGLEGEGIAYFSAEYGIHECLPIYSGGLGVLSGDHLKSSSELGLPLYGIGLLYRMGYFRQYLNPDGWQQEKFPQTDFYNIPVKLVLAQGNEPVIIGVEYPGRSVYAQIWEVKIGKVILYLLDTNIDQNKLVDKAITDHLYGGDTETRIQQEIMLGIGGMRALEALNINITAFHMNEGHAAFLEGRVQP